MVLSSQWGSSGKNRNINTTSFKLSFGLSVELSIELSIDLCAVLNAQWGKLISESESIHWEFRFGF